MKIPKSPPNHMDVFNRLLKERDNRLIKVINSTSIVDEKGRYLHWDDLRRKQPPEGLTPEEFWAAVKFSRAGASQRLFLADNRGQPFTYCEPPALRNALRSLDMRSGGFLASHRAVPIDQDAKRYLIRSLAEEPFASSMIEGAATTRRIAEQLIYENRKPRTKDERMVLNNYRALEYVKANKDKPLTMEMLLELHDIVASGTFEEKSDEGRLRRSNDIHVMDNHGEVLHQPPDFSTLPARLQSLFDFANQEPDEEFWLHPLTKAIILHFMIGYEHPFVDGNGRVARALFYWLALKSDYWLLEYVSISSVIAKSVVEYGKAYLHTETDAGDLTYFVLYNVSVLTQALDSLDLYINRRKQEFLEFENSISEDRSFNHRQAWLLREATSHKTSHVTIETYRIQHRIGYLTARKDLEDLLAAGLLRKSKHDRMSVYSPVQNISERLQIRGL